MTDAEFAIKIFNWFTGNKKPENEGDVYINGVLQRFYELPERNREILTCRLRDGLTFKKIGEIYGISANAVRSNTVNSHRLFLYAKCHTPVRVSGLIEQTRELWQDLKKMHKELFEKTAYIDSLNRSIESLTEKRSGYSYPAGRKKIQPEDFSAAVYKVLFGNGIRYYEDLCKFWCFEDMRSSIRNLGPNRMFEVLKVMWEQGYSEWILDTYEISAGLKKEIGEKFAECGICLDRPELYIKQKADS